MRKKILLLIIAGIAIGTLGTYNIANGNDIDGYLIFVGLVLALGGIIALGTKSNDDDDDTPKKL